MDLFKLENTSYIEDPIHSCGDVTLSPSNAIFKMGINGICEIEFEHPYDQEGRWKFIQGGCVVKAAVPYTDKEQLFVIYGKDKDLFGIVCRARHIMYDLGESICLDRRAENKTCQQAGDILLEGTPFKFHSNIDKVATCYFVEANRLALLNGSNRDNTIIKRWGGEIVPDNYDINVVSQMGKQDGLEINYGVNLENINLNEEWDGVITRCYPKAFNGYMLPEKFIDSPLKDKYRIIKEGFLSFEDLKLKKDCSEDEEGFDTLEQLYGAMRARVKSLYEEGLDRPKLMGEISIIDLENTIEYQHVKNLVKAGLGDKVIANSLDYGIEVNTRIIEVEWDILAKKYTKMTIGEYTPNFFVDQVNTTEKVNNILNSDGSVNSAKLKGFIDATQASIKAMKESATLQHLVVMQCEDLDPASPYYGSMLFGTKGVMISDQKENGEWNYTTALTARGILANVLYGRILAGSSTYFDLDSGELSCTLPDGSTVVMSAKDGFFRRVGSTKNEYHSLIKVYEKEVNTSGIGNTFEFNLTLPDEFKGKNFLIIPIITDAVSQDNSGKTLYLAGRNGVWYKNVNKNAGTFTIFGQYLGFKVLTTNEFGGVIDTGKVFYGRSTSDPSVLPLKVSVSILVIA